MYTFKREDLQQNQPQKTRLFSNSKLTKRAILAVGLMILVLLAGVWLQRTSTAYAIVINGKQTVVFDSKAEAEQCINDFLKEKSQELGKTISIPDKVEIKKVEVDQKDKIFTGDASKVLGKELNMLVPGAVVQINGEDRVFLTDKKAADGLIEKIKTGFTPEGKDLKIVKVEVKEKVQVLEQKVPVKEIADEGTAFKLLTVGSKKLVTHVVASGESLWSIAKDNNMKVSDLEAANPEINPDKIQIGDEIKLVKAEPMVHVISVAEYKEVKTIPFQSEIITDNSLIRGKQTVKQDGENGSKEFNYLLVQVNGQQTDKQFVGAKVLSPPVNKVVVKGTKLVLASRGGSSLRWPLRGIITSPFGYRHGEFHTGVDIDGSTGDPVRAAEAGRVCATGWEGNYGNLIKIDHGNGIQTWYAHLSAYETSVGEEVEAGEVIGRVGNTGRSYGSHLHFEVRISGNAVNPLKYL